MSSPAETLVYSDEVFDIAKGNRVDLFGVSSPSRRSPSDKAARRSQERLELEVLRVNILGWIEMSLETSMGILVRPLALLLLPILLSFRKRLLPGFYNSLPPISKAYGTLCLAATTLATLKLLPIYYIALIYGEVFYRLQVWRLLTNFIFLGPFSINFGIRLLMILRYGVQLENGPFNRRTADFLWMMIFGSSVLLVLATIPFFESFFMGVSLVFMLLYVWSREFPTANINIYGLVQLKAFYLPWAMLALDVIFGSPIWPDLCGILAGHLYYFLTVLHPLAGGKNILQTPIWLRKIVARYRIGAPASTQPQTTSNNSGVFRGRSYRVGG